MSKSNSLTYTVASSFVCTSPLAVITVLGSLDTHTVSNSADFRSFLLSMCIDAPESTTYYLASGFITDVAETQQTSVVQKKVALSFSLSFGTPLAILHASPRAHRSCLSVSS